MALSQMTEVLRNGSHMLLGLILVVLEKVVEHDFVCPCRRDFTMLFFFVYLLGPTLVTLIFGILLLQPNTCLKSYSWCCWNFVSCIVPPAVWLAMFFSDGKYVACFYAELKVEYAKKDQQFSWDPCVNNRTLTDDQLHSQIIFFTTKFIGFAVLVLISCIALIYYKHRTKSRRPAPGSGFSLGFSITIPSRPGLRSELEGTFMAEMNPTMVSSIAAVRQLAARDCIL
ncbi:hypothetical protein NFI96_002242 [Prochilodus magdalenae]|nr:hypothetical protein NFI96_002242 [Prochilodus magdalenae]